jgi:DNA transposition AAA+ family ATPase
MPEPAATAATDAAASPITMSADVVKQALRQQLDAGQITAEQEELLWWSYCHARQQGWDLKEAARQFAKDTTTLYRVWAGKYGARLDSICADLASLRRLFEERATRTDIGFVETSVWRIIEKTCTAAHVSQTVAWVFGDSQVGKTTALMEYARRNNHGLTRYVRMPASAGVQLVMKEIARCCYISPHSSFESLRDRVLNSIDQRTLLIFDEMHQAFLSYQSGSTIKVFEVVREIYDRTGCGMVLCGTNTLRRELLEGKLAAVLEQLRRRGTIQVRLPASPPKADLDRIAKRFGLLPADGVAAEVVCDMIHQSGLGMYLKFLQAASQMAAREKRKLSWDHFVQAHDIIRRLSS